VDSGQTGLCAPQTKGNKANQYNCNKVKIWLPEPVFKTIYTVSLNDRARKPVPYVNNFVRGRQSNLIIQDIRHSFVCGFT